MKKDGALNKTHSFKDVNTAVVKVIWLKVWVSNDVFAQGRACVKQKPDGQGSRANRALNTLAQVQTYRKSVWKSKHTFDGPTAFKASMTSGVCSIPNSLILIGSHIRTTAYAVQSVSINVLSMLGNGLVSVWLESGDNDGPNHQKQTRITDSF